MEVEGDVVDHGAVATVGPAIALGDPLDRQHRARFSGARDRCGPDLQRLRRGVRQSLPAGVRRRDGGEETLGVLVLRMREDLVGGALLHHPTVLHDQHVIGQALHHCEVVADQDDRAALREAVLQQREDLGLHGDVERRGGLVGDEDLGVQGERGGDQRTLAQPAGQLAGQLTCPQLGLGDPGGGEEILHPTGALGARDAVQPQRFGDLGADPSDRVQRSQGVLEDVPDPAPPQSAELLLRGGAQVSADVERGGGDRGVLAVQPQQTACGDGLARAGLPHDPQAAAGPQGEGDVVDDRRAVEGDREVLGGDQGLHRAAPESVARWR